MGAKLSLSRGIDYAKVMMISGSEVDLYACRITPRVGGADGGAIAEYREVREYVAAAQYLRASGISAHFGLLGAPDPANPATFQPLELDA